MFLHEDGCICPKPQFAKHIKGPNQQKACTNSMSPFYINVCLNFQFIKTSSFHIFNVLAHLVNPLLNDCLSSDLSMAIPGGSIQYVSSGEGVMLECLISGLTSPPMSIYWEKGSKVMTVKERSGVSIETEKMAGVSRSSLYIARTELSDTGNYSCVSDALTEAVLLVVTQEDDTHASQTRNRVSSGADKIVVSMAAVPVMAVVLAITAS